MMKLDNIQRFKDFVRYTVTASQGFGWQATIHLDLDPENNILESSAIQGELADRVKDFVLNQ